MREIKFRVWCKNRNEWEKDVCFIGLDGNIYQQRFASPVLLPVNMDNHVIMQFTGLKDRNGVEIYEGDILCGWIGSHWHSGEDKFEEVVKYDEKTASYNFPAIEVRHGDLRVIGNIFESGEILNDSENP